MAIASARERSTGTPGLAGEDLLERLLDEPLDEVVGLHAEPLAPRHLDVGAAAVLVGERRRRAPRRRPGVSATIS